MLKLLERHSFMLLWRKGTLGSSLLNWKLLIWDYIKIYGACENFNNAKMLWDSIKVIQFQTCHEPTETLTVVSRVAGIVTVALVLTNTNALPCAFPVTTQHQLSQSKTGPLRIENTLSYFISSIALSV